MGLHGKIVHGAISGPTAAAGHPAAVIVSSAHLFDSSAPGPLTWIPDERRPLARVRYEWPGR